MFVHLQRNELIQIIMEVLNDNRQKLITRAGIA